MRCIGQRDNRGYHRVYLKDCITDEYQVRDTCHVLCKPDSCLYQMVAPRTKCQAADVTVANVSSEAKSQGLFLFLCHVTKLPLFFAEVVDEVPLAFDQLLYAVVSEGGNDEHANQTKLQQT